MFSPEVIQAAKEHGLAEYPKESVGGVIDGQYVPFENTAADPEVSFRLEFFPEVEALVHSHSQDPSTAPSAEDMHSQQGHGKPWGIFSTYRKRASDFVWFGDSCPIPHYIGRRFVSGVTDCWCLARDIYRGSLGVGCLPNIPRDEDWYKGLDAKDLLSLDNIKQAGFFQVDVSELKPWDLVLGSIQSRVTNHCGVYIGRNLILHHTDRILSCRVPITPWLKRIRYFLRHEALADRDDLPTPEEGLS